MDNTLTQSFAVRTSQCDHQGRLGIAATLDCFMDIATVHSELLGCGIPALRAKGRFWVAVKTRLRLYRQPALGEICDCETWPEAPGLRKSERDYLLRVGDELVAAGRNEWTILDRGTGGPCAMREGVYPENLPLRTDAAMEGSYHRFLGPFPEEPFAEYQIRSTDIDLAGHMNNVAYLRMLLGCISTAEQNAHPLREAELHYRASAYEGQTLLLRRRPGPRGMEYQAALPDGTLILLARLEQA